MEKSVAARRKVQQLARDGLIDRAIGELERLLQAGEPDPYDFVFHGDLMIRAGRIEDGIASYEEAISAYERVGLYRNAIAIGKKILRIQPERARTLRRLGDLYAKEGLTGEAVSHFLSYLDRAGGEASGEEFIETLERVSQLSGPRVEVALRLAELYNRAGRQDRAARLLEEVADSAGAAGGFDVAFDLRERARSMNSDRLPPVVEQRPATQPIPTQGPDLELSIESSITGECSIEETVARAPTPKPGPEPEQDDSIREPIVVDPRMIEIDEALETGDAERARQLAIAMHDEAPEDPSAVEKLIAASQLLDDTLATIRYLTLLGDLRITAEDLEGSLSCFLRVLELDPGNGTARRRLARFREMGIPGAEGVAEATGGVDEGPRRRLSQGASDDAEREKPPGASIREVLDTRDATVSIRDDGGAQSDEWIDLTALLEEFREGVRNGMDPGDYAAHYDLGLSHLEMGLFEESIEELDCVLAVPNVPKEMELKAREIKGNALLRLERHREAIHEYRRALTTPGVAEKDRLPVRYQLACALEATGDLDEARTIFRSVIENGGHGLFDVEEHLARLGG